MTQLHRAIRARIYAQTAVCGSRRCDWGGGSIRRAGMGLVRVYGTRTKAKYYCTTWSNRCGRPTIRTAKITQQQHEYDVCLSLDSSQTLAAFLRPFLNLCRRNAEWILPGKHAPFLHRQLVRCIMGYIMHPPLPYHSVVIETSGVVVAPID